LGLRGAEPSMVITDLGIPRPDPGTCELVLTDVHPGVETEEVRATTGRDLRVAPDMRRTEPPSEDELAAQRRLGGDVAAG